MALKAIRGFKDILPDESPKWQLIEETARDVFALCGLSEIRTPVLEKTEVFTRGIGEHTDIVEKEMYTFKDRNGESLSLRPEATAGIIRSVIEHKLFSKSPVLTLFTMGPMFRHERPQKGRLRQFHQLNVEYLGTDSPLSDAEVIWLAWTILSLLTDSQLRLEINSLGCPRCRPNHRKDLAIFLETTGKKLCKDCRRRAKTNPLRIFDCKNEECRQQLLTAPLIKHYLCPDCAQHLGIVLDALEAYEIPFVQNPYLVRGLDYYVRTTFEIVSPDLGAQSTVAAGGRYDGLVKDLGGPDLPGVGMAIGVERLLLILDQEPEQEPIELFVAMLGREAREEMLPVIGELRRNGISVRYSFDDKSLKAQMKMAGKAGARYCLIVGEQEVEEETAILRDMETKEQQEVEFQEITARLTDLLGSSEE